MVVHTRTESAPATSFWSATRLVAEREVQAYVRSKAFWLSFGVLLLGLFAASILPGVFGGGAPTVATVGTPAEQAAAEADLEVTPRPDRAAAEELVRAGEVDAAVVPDGGPTGLRVIALDTAPDQVVTALGVTPPVDLLDPAEVESPVRFLVSFAFGLVFLIFGMSFGMGLAQSVVIEKQTRIVEILVATVPVRALLAGKIAGHSLLLFGQVAVLALAAPLALRAGGRQELLALLAPALGWFVPYFVLGFVLLAAMWAVAGAVVSRQEDLGSSTPLMTFLVMIPYFAVIFLNENQLVMTVLSYVPFSAAVAMPLRLFTGEAAVWEPLLSMLLLTVTMIVTVLVASRLYAGSLLHTGGRVKLSRAWSRQDLAA